MSQSNFCYPSFTAATRSGHPPRESAHLILDRYLSPVHAPASPFSKSQKRVSPEFIHPLLDSYILGVINHHWRSLFLSINSIAKGGQCRPACWRFRCLWANKFWPIRSDGSLFTKASLPTPHAYVCPSLCFQKA